mmetsp:Transcript_124382/g.348371  ORF Transcript_124382/g.348371 Transcript_124382/m.348371 type:complete len:219 (-) Transcript_124382:1919-2575(-)
MDASPRPLLSASTTLKRRRCGGRRTILRPQRAAPLPPQPLHRHCQPRRPMLMMPRRQAGSWRRASIGRWPTSPPRTASRRRVVLRRQPTPIRDGAQLAIRRRLTPRFRWPPRHRAGPTWPQERRCHGAPRQWLFAGHPPQRPQSKKARQSSAASPRSPRAPPLLTLPTRHLRRNRPGKHPEPLSAGPRLPPGRATSRIPPMLQVCRQQRATSRHRQRH